MTTFPSTPWHKASYDKFLSERLPQLLAERLPLDGYSLVDETPQSCCIHLELSSGVQADYPRIPRPNENGAFMLDGELRVVVPLASSEELERAEIDCVGEQLYDYIQEHLGQASNGITWDAEFLSAWLPLDRWINDFLQGKAQALDTTNWLSRHTHLRRIFIPEWKEVIAPGQIGRVCPFETPEGPNIGRVLTVALGAQIRDRRLLIVDDRPEAGLGLSSAMLPFLEHNDANRLLFATNFQRQSLPAPDPEPALVQTGNEPDAPDFWCGRNLLTAFASMGAATTEDGIVISVSAARRLNFPYPAEVGDKLTNRHGIKGVVSQVLPDDEMPHLPDGTPVELVYSFTGLPTRLVLGPVLEAAWGRVAYREGQPVIVPPFAAPSQADLCQRLKAAGLPESGQERLTFGKNGPQADFASTVGWVYWSRSVHLSRQKILTSASGHPAFSGRLEARALLDAGAYENLREVTNTRSTRREEAASLAQRIAAGPVEQAGYPTPLAADLQARLASAGITVSLSADGLSFHLEAPQGEVLKLACPLPHPWLDGHFLEVVGVRPDLEEYNHLVEANQRLNKLLGSQVPERLLQEGRATLEKRLKAFLEALLTPEHLGFEEQVAFSGRAMVAPGPALRSFQVGLAEEIAWALFEPLVIRQLGDAQAAQARQPEAVQALDALMERSWVVINHAPSLTPTTMLAFRPLRIPEPVIRLHPLACPLLNADFDGDQVVVHLPVTEDAQREAGEKLTIAAHLQRDPSLACKLLLHADLMWGLAWLALKPDGRAQIADALGMQAPEIPELLTQSALCDLLEKIFQQRQVELALDSVERLMQLGYQAAQSSGASLNPFFGSGLSLPSAPQYDDPSEWQAYADEIAEAILSRTDYTDPVFGVQLLAAKTRLRNRRSLPLLVGPRGLVQDAAGRFAVIRHSLSDGFTPDEMHQVVAGARRGLAEVLLHTGMLAQLESEGGEKAAWPVSVSGLETRRVDKTSWTVLARARSSKHPGIVFARAAASGEIDPLDDLESRLMVGVSLPVT
jgi:hypothetical protein